LVIRWEAAACAVGATELTAFVTKSAGTNLLFLGRRLLLTA
jgi:hypothetical protein